MANTDQVEDARPAFPAVDGPGKFKVIGVDRPTRMDVVQYVDAELLENARVKGELQGMVVTRVERA